MAKIKGSEIIDLTDAIQQVNTLTEAYNKLDDQLKETAQLAQKSTQSLSAESVSDINKLNKAYQETEKAKKDALAIDKQIAKNLDQEAKLRAKLESIQKGEQDQIIKLRAEINKENAERRKNAKEILNQGDAFKKLTADTNKAQAEFKRLAAEFGIADDRAQQARKEFQKLDTQLREINDEARDGRRDVGRYALAFENVKEQLSGTFESISQNGLGFQGITKSIGGIVSKIGPVGVAIGGVVAGLGAVGSAVIGLEKEFNDLAKQAQRATGLTGSALDELVIKTKALSETFGEDTNDLFLAQNTLIKEFGLSSDEAFKIVSTGLQSSANAQGDLLDNIKEYSSQIRESGGSAEDLVSILDKAGEEGIFSDKGIDVVKEFGLRIREQTTATQEALENAFGESFTQRLLEGVRSGALSSVDALKLVSKELETVDDVAKAQTVIADVFGGPGEDAGRRFIEQLQFAGGEIDSIVDKTDPLIQQQERQLALQEELARAQQGVAESVLGSGATLNELFLEIKIALFEALSGIINFFRENEFIFDRLSAPLRIIIDLFKLIADIIEGDFKNAFAKLKTITSEYIKFITFGLVNIEEIQKDLQESTKKLTEEEEKRLAVARRTQVVNEQALGIGKQILSQQKDEIQNAQILLDALESENVSREDKQKILDRLQAQYPEILGKIELETLKSEDLIKVKKALTAQILEDAIARREQEEIAKRTNEIIEIEIQRVIQNNATLGQARLEQLNNEIKLIGLIKNRITSELGNISENLDLTGGFDRLTDELTRVNEALEKATDPQKIAKLNRERDDLIKQQERLLGLGKELNKQNKEANEIRSSGESSRELELKQAEDFNKTLEERDKVFNDEINAKAEAKQKEFDLEDKAKQERENLIKEENKNRLEDFDKQTNEELKALERRLILEGKTTEEINERLLTERQKIAEQRLAEIIDIFGEGSAEAIDAELKLLNEAKALKDKQAEDDKKRREQEIKELKEFAQDQIEIFKDITQAVQDRRQSEIDALNESIGERQTEVSRLEELALAGNQAAAESLAAEKDAIERERNEIDSLEKKKRNLQIVILGLSQAQSLLDQGDGNALSNAGTLVKDFLANLPQFYTGTEGTVADVLGRTGTRDGHFVRLHDTEHVIGAEQSSKLHAAGLNKTSDIVESALAHHNNDNGKKMMGLKRPNQFNDTRIVRRLESVEKAINNIDIAQHHYDLKNLTETIKKGNTTKVKKFETGIIRFS